MFYDRFISLCKERGVSPSSVMISIGLNKSNATFWKKGSVPSSANVQKLADYFGVSVDYLLGNESADRPIHRPTEAKTDNFEEDLEKLSDAARSAIEPPKIPKISERQLAQLMSDFADALKEIKEKSPEKFEKHGFSLSDVDKDIENLYDWAAILNYVLMMSGFSEDGAKKVADYAEDILPRYRRQDPAQPPAEDTPAHDTPAAQDAPERAEEGE